MSGLPLSPEGFAADGRAAAVVASSDRASGGYRRPNADANAFSEIVSALAGPAAAPGRPRPAASMTVPAEPVPDGGALARSLGGLAGADSLSFRAGPEPRPAEEPADAATLAAPDLDAIAAAPAPVATGAEALEAATARLPADFGFGPSTAAASTAAGDAAALPGMAAASRDPSAIGPTEMPVPRFAALATGRAAPSRTDAPAPMPGTGGERASARVLEMRTHFAPVVAQPLDRRSEAEQIASPSSTTTATATATEAEAGHARAASEGPPRAGERLATRASNATSPDLHAGPRPEPTSTDPVARRPDPSAASADDGQATVAAEAVGPAPTSSPGAGSAMDQSLRTLAQDIGRAARPLTTGETAAAATGFGANSPMLRRDVEVELSAPEFGVVRVRMRMHGSSLELSLRTDRKAELERSIAETGVDVKVVDVSRTSAPAPSSTSPHTQAPTGDSGRSGDGQRFEQQSSPDRNDRRSPSDRPIDGTTHDEDPTSRAGARAGTLFV